VNAADHFVARLSSEAARRLAVRRVRRFAPGGAERLEPDGPRAPLSIDEARAVIAARWAGDLCGLLNALTRAELSELAIALGAPAPTDEASSALRLALWHRGAALERGGADIGCALQPVPHVLGGHLVIAAPPRGLYPPAPVWPRPLPLAVDATPMGDEPDDLDALLAAADRALGVPLGPRGRDKGAWGTRAARLLGVVDRGADEPDWRGDVEIKTVPVAREPSGLWRIVEDPAIAMLGGTSARAAAPAVAKLQRTLWLARANSDDGGATLVSWYLLPWDADVAQLARRYLHVRPKGPRGTDQRGVYLHKRFFADAGLLATLNGPGAR